ncbi:tannase and feruloyl esterase-domain-containing protein [Auriculariales sp. MPI-PUGE-AT-0066]|nr:tannase and feruloyl esterase-domain-containing protein [Auriculariales sp. MPI-PUGE-AT-0066]
MVNVAAATTHVLSAQSRCAALPSAFTTPGLASVETQYVTGGTIVALPTVGVDCQQVFNMAAAEVPAPQNLCFVSLAINTSSASTTRLTVWLPDNYNGRFLGTGNGGMSGCTDWQTISYGASLGFASSGTDNGHTGQTGEPLLNAPEVFTDFAWRSVHVEATVGKEVVEAYYGSRPSYSYMTGCSMGGRQGFNSAENFPEDFDGIIACAPVLNAVNMWAWFGFVAQPFLPTAPGAMTPDTWAIVREETYKQCDHLDGAVDGTISYPADCKRPQKLYTDMYDPQGRFFSPRYDLGAEQSNPALFGLTFGNQLPLPFFTFDTWRYVVYSDPAWPGTTFNWTDFAAGEPKLSEMATWSGDLRAFKQRGGKIINIHGTEDVLIPSGISPRQYELTASVTGKHDMDKWYALYMVPGHTHCYNTGSVAKGAWRFGQLGGIPEPRAASNTSLHNVLLALVDWVEKKVEPKRLIGMTDNGETREVCRYPSKGHWTNGVWKCGQR